MLKKYLPFFKASSMDLMAFKFNILIWLVITIIAIFILSRAAAAVYAAGLTPKY